jgi:8-oxo-dGTP pyrophosphatase MutT (NUDIX family)
MSAGFDDVRRALVAAPQRVTEAVGGRAAVAVILRERESELQALFIRRAEHPLDPWSGQMAFPGGRQDPGDVDLLATALRETAEEVGVDLARSGELLGALDEVRAMARMRPMDLVITPYVFRLCEPVEPVLNLEVRSVHWVPLPVLSGPEHRSTHPYEHAGAQLRFPCVQWEGLVIWGLTYRMCTSLFERMAVPTGEATA